MNAGAVMALIVVSRSRPSGHGQRYCSPACRKTAFRASECVAEPEPLPSPVSEPATHSLGSLDSRAPLSGGISPLRYRPQLGDKDIRDNREDTPDEILLVDTTIESEWTIWSLFRSGTPWPDEETVHRYVEFNPVELTEV